MNEILGAFLEYGLNPGPVVISDGKIHRFKVDKDDHKNSGWYVSHQNHSQSGGEIFQVCVFGNYREGVTHTYHTDLKYTSHDRKAIKEQVEKAKKLAEAQRLKHQSDVSDEVNEKWEKLSTEGTSDYITKKHISDCRENGVKFDDKGNLYVPLRDIEGKLWSLQKIQWDSSKFFHPGGRIQGCFHQIGNDQGSRIIITEGFATAASIHLATKEKVICAFTASNLVLVAKEIRKKYPDSDILICGDDDIWTTKRKDGEDIPWNPGREKAEEAAKASLGKAIFPKFKILTERKTTDFNDLHCAEGLDAVRAQLCDVEIPKLALYALGFKESEFFFTSTSNRQVVGITSFSEDNLLKLLPIDYWEQVFPSKGTGRVDWTSAKSEIMSKCRSKGIFQSRHVRGAGVWMDEGRIVVNMGNHLIVDGERVELGNIKSNYFYTLGVCLSSLRSDPLSVEECMDFIKTANHFKWIKPESGMLLAGALVCSRVCGALPIRPHTWVTGGAQTGKTTLLEQLIDKIMGKNKLYFNGSTSEAGVRQSLKADALPILFDEFETTDHKSGEKIASLIELMRVSWAESGGTIVKGGASGNASHFQVRFSAIVSSIRTKLTNDADKGRFAILELAPHGSDQEHWRELSVLLSKIDSDYSERLFARVIGLLPTMLENFKLIKRALATRVDSRFGDQYGMLLAGYSILLQDEPIDVSDAEFLAENVELSEEKDNSKVTDHDDALEHLLTTKVQFNTYNGSRQESLIGELIESVCRNATPNGEIEALTRLGIKVDSSKREIYIVQANHAELESKVWRGEKWSKIWGNSLGRLPGAQKNRLIWISGKGRRCISLPFDLFFSAK